MDQKRLIEQPEAQNGERRGGGVGRDRLPGQ